MPGKSRRWPWEIVPAGLRFPALLGIGLLGWVAIGDRDPAGAAGLALLIGTALGLVAGGQLWARRRMRARRANMPSGAGVWRATVDRFGLWDLFGPGRRGSWLGFDALVLDVVVTEQELTLAPTWGGRKVGGFRVAHLGWDDLAEVRAAAPVHEVGSRAHLTALTPVTLVLVGDRIDDLHRPMTDEEASDEGLGPAERADLDAEIFQDLREDYGKDYRFGTWPVTVLVDDPTGLIELLRQYQRGCLPGEPSL